MAKSFAAQVSEWVDATEQSLDAVFKQSVQEIFEIAQTPKSAGGRMPVDTGNLRASLTMYLDGSKQATGENAYILTLAKTKFGSTIRGQYENVAYALRMEYGFVGTDSLGRQYNQKGNFFVGNAVAQWQNIVDKNARLLAARKKIK